MRLMNCMLLLLVILLVAILAGPAEAQTDEAPYLYYFSREFNAFMIERADGTDRHWLGQGIARENASNIDGPGWSPSGQWLAWTENRFTIEQNHGNNPFVMHIDGTHRLTLLDDFNDAVLAWAPGEHDILLVAGTKNELVNESDTIVYMLVVDMTTETVLTSVEAQRPARKYFLSFEPEETHYLSAGHLEMDWLPDGEHAAVYLEGVIDRDGSELAPSIVYVLDVTGEVELREISPLTITTQPISARGWIAYGDDSGQLVLENILSGQRETVTVEGGFYFARMRWSPDGRYLLAQGVDRGLYLVDTADFTVILLDERGKFDTPTRYDWQLEYWSPGSNYVVFTAQSAAMPTIFYSYLYEIATQNITQLPVYIDYGDPSIELGNWYWTNPDDLVFALWHSEAHIWEFTQYQVSTGIFRTAAASDSKNFLAVYTAYLSPGGRYITRFHETVGFLDMQTGTEMLYPPDSRSYLSNMVGEVAWHPGEAWAILYEDAGVAGGGVLRWTEVSRLDGSLRRELGWCSSQGQQCIGWLPPQVDVTALPSAPVLHDMTEPSLEITGTHWIYYLNWSPDGTHLAAGANGHGDGTLSVWNLAEGRVVESFPVDEIANVKEYDVQIEWQPDYTLHVIPGDPVGRPLTYSPDGRFYAKAHYEGAGVYDANTDIMLHPLDIGNFNYTLSFTNDGRFLAVIHDEFPAYLIDTETWETVLTFDTHATAAAFSPDNAQLALANGWNVQVWDMRAFYDSIGYEPAG
jgi:WD40 repeat protein